MRSNKGSSYQAGWVRWRKLKDGTDVADLQWREKDACGEWQQRHKCLRGVGAKEAQRELDRILADINAGNGISSSGPVAPRITFGDLVERHWYAYVDKQRMRPSTVAGYKAPLEKILAFFGPMPLKEINAGQISEFMTQLRGTKLSTKYQRNIYDLLRCLFDLAFTYDLIAVTPVKPKLHKPDVERQEKTVLPIEKWREFFLALPMPWRVPMLILLTTGMRQGELLALRWSNIDFKRRMISKTHVYWRGQVLPGLKNTKKTGQSKHEVGMSELMYHALQQHQEVSLFKASEDFVFCNSHGQVWNPDTMRDVIHRAMVAVGIEVMPRSTGAHMFRHTAASYLLATTGDLKLASEQLGHADIQTTANIYTHSNDERRLKSAEILSAPLVNLIEVN